MSTLAGYDHPALSLNKIFGSIVPALQSVLWLWLVYLLALVFNRLFNQWDLGFWFVSQFLLLVTATAIPVKLLAQQRSHADAVAACIAALLLLAVPVAALMLITDIVSPLYFSLGGKSTLWIAVAARAVYHVSVGALIVACISNRSVRWLTVLASPLLLWPLTLVFHRMPPGQDAGLHPLFFLSFLNAHPLMSLALSIPAAIMAGALWRVTVPGDAAGSSTTGLATRELLAKELRLQKSNIIFASATMFIGGLAIMFVSTADPNIAAFSVEDVRAALFTIILLPALVLILPVMIGSTAVAAEKPMGVNAWHSALPVSLWNHIYAKAIVTVGLVTVVAGIAPYLIQVTMSDELSVNYYLRDNWPGWIGILCAAIGFYSGSWTRDDYHGLLFSVVPIALLIGVMAYADPLFLVFPLSIPHVEPFWKEWLVALRLLLISTAFVWAATRNLRSMPGHRKAVSVFAHLAVIGLTTFGLTLYNVVKEYSLLEAPTRQSSPYSRPLLNVQGISVSPSIIATAQSSARPFNSYITLPSNGHNAGQPYLIGSVERKWPNQRSDGPGNAHTIVILPHGQVREFTNVPEKNVIGVSANGRWIHSRLKSGEILSGPGGLSIASYLIPDMVFDLLASQAGIVYTKNSSNHNWVISDVHNSQSVITIRGVTPVGTSKATSATATLKEWKIATRRPQENGTTITISNTGWATPPVTRVGNQHYMHFIYQVSGPVTIGNRTVAANTWLGRGVLLVNLNSGEEQLVPYQFPWNENASVTLFENFNTNKTESINWYSYSNDYHPDGPIAMADSERVIIANPMFKDWKDHIQFITAQVPGAREINFISPNELIVSDGINLWLMPANPKVLHNKNRTQ